jgi:HK97 family phage prohead protease
MKLFNTKAEIEDVDKGIVKIRVSAFGNIDSYGDIMDEKAFNQTINVFNSGKRTRIKHLQDHDWSKLVGLPMEITKTSQGLDIVSKMNIEKQFVKDIYSDYKFMADNGDTLEHSIGYVTIKEVKSEEHNANILKEVDLKEYSSLNFLGANGETPLLDIKQMLEKGEYSDEKCKQLELKITELENQLKSFEQGETTQTDEGKDTQIKSSINPLLLL